MAFTRPQQKQAFDYVLNDVLDRDDSSGLKKSLQENGINDILSLLGIDNFTVENLTYERSPTEPHHPVNRGDKSLIRAFISYVEYVRSNGNPLSSSTEWMALTHTEFDAYRVSHYIPLNGPNAPTPNVNVTASGAPIGVTPVKYSKADIFRRGIKRDPNSFPVLKEEKFNDSWHRSFENQARAQDVFQVLDPTYVPIHAEDIELFDEKQKYVYAILEQKVLTDRGKGFVRDHERTYDAQKVYEKLVDHHLKSTKAMIDSSSILSYITSVRLGNGTWKGTTEAFLVHWQDQVRLYERQVPLSDYFSDGQKRTMLENAVAPISELRQVKNTADLEKTKTGRTLLFEEYASLLLSASAAYDEEFQPKHNSKQRLAVYAHDIDDTYNNVEDYDIDASVTEIQANAHNRMSRFKTNKSRNDQPAQRTRMPFDRWAKLSTDDRATWDKLDDSAKATILGTPMSSSANSTSTRTVNLHDISAYDFIQANVHETANDNTADDQQEYYDTKEAEDQNIVHDSTLLVNSATSQKPLTPGDIRRVMSTASKRYQGSKSSLEANMHATYIVSNHHSASQHSLVDRGSNGGVAGSDVRVISKTHRKVDIQGINNHRLNDIEIGTVGAYVNTQKGPIIAIFHQYALFCKGTTIHSPGQFEYYKNDVNDKSIHVGGLQRIRTLEGYLVPLNIKNGRARMQMRPYTDDEWDTTPHVFFTSELEWNPTVLDHVLTDDDQWYDAVTDLEADPTMNLYDEFGNYRRRVVVQCAENGSTDQTVPYEGIDDLIDRCAYSAYHTSIFKDFPPDVIENYQHENFVDSYDDSHDETTTTACSSPRQTSKKEPDFALLRPLFGWLSADIIKSTFSSTTQYGRLPTGTHLKNSYKSANPALNVHRRNEDVACDFVYADVPAIDDGATSAVLFVGTTTLVTDVYSVKSDKQFVNTLEDNIRERGAPNKLVSDRAQVEISNKVLGILRTLFISAWQSEPHQQQQNPAERRIQTVKTTSNRVMDRTGAPAHTWLLCLLYVCYLLNHTYNESIKGVPLNNLTGSTVDISPLLRFHFWQKVYYKATEDAFPSESKEAVGHIVGISEHVGPMMTWKVLSSDTKKILYRSQIRAHDSTDLNLRAELFGGEDTPTSKFIKSRVDRDGESTQLSTPVFNPEDLVGRTFLLDKEDDGQRHRAKIVELIEDFENDVNQNPTLIKFVCKHVDGDKAEEIITYNQMLDFIARDEDTDITWKFKRIVSHQGPLKSEHPDYKGSMYNVMIEWENGESTTEPLSIVAADDPVTCALYAKEKNLLEAPGWKRFKSIARREKKLLRMVNQAKLRSFNTAPKYKYGFEVPRNYQHALRLDELNKNSKWHDSVDTELDQIDEYDTFKDLGHKSKAKPPPGHKKIRVHLVFDIKHDGRHKARLVADGHLTDVPLESVYSGVVSLRGFRLVLFLAELNKLEAWATDIGNAYLEAETAEKVYIEAGPEFGDRYGHLLIIRKALYGLRSSGARWHEKLSDCLRELGFQPCKAEPDIWLRRNGNIYEYVAVYVDDLAIVMHDPQAFADVLMQRYKFKLKGTGIISVHLGMDIYRDSDKVLCISARKYIARMVDTYERIFKEAPKQVVTSPLEKGDHPELDTSDMLMTKVSETTSR